MVSDRSLLFGLPPLVGVHLFLGPLGERDPGLLGVSFAGSTPRKRVIAMIVDQMAQGCILSTSTLQGCDVALAGPYIPGTARPLQIAKFVVHLAEMRVLIPDCAEIKSGSGEHD
jgi:hypothetical protein